jgi:hypothetical protein
MTPPRRLFDTNLLVIANGHQSQQATRACQDRCEEEIIAALFGEVILVLDRGAEGERSAILDEYRRNLRAAGDGLGDRFLKWLTDRIGDARNCVLVPITKKGDTYAEFPDDRRLAKFDPADHKWIATACAHRDLHGAAPEIAQAADAKWAEYVHVFEAHGLSIDFICGKPDNDVKSGKPKRPKKPR